MDSGFVVSVIVFWVIVGGLITPLVYRRKERNPWMGVFVGAVLGGLGGLILLVPLWLFLPTLGKKCPRCAEKVRKDALVCKYCGYEFPSAY